MSKTRHTAKDSVFTYLFRQPGNALQLYKAIHPEDTTVTEADLKIITLEHILMTGQFNDFGILVRDRLILLMEAQSTFSPNIPLRLFLYLADSYKDYVETNKLSLYKTTPITIPRPELYMLYTGEKPLTSDTLRMSDLYDGPGDAEIAVHILKRSGTGTILDQYVAFCTIFNQQISIHGRTEQAISEVIRLCLQQKILVPFLSEQKREVTSILCCDLL